MHESIQWYSDNVNVSRIIQVGSRKPDLHCLALDIFDLCIQFNLHIQPSWIPREENEFADMISKFVDTDSWTIDLETFSFIESKFGKFTVDRFSDDLNKKCSRFNSRFFCPGTESVNCFTCDWSNDFNWLCPPISLIGATLKHMRLCRAKGVLLVPNWPSSYFWPLLSSDGETFNDFIKSYLLLDPYFINYAGCKSVFDGHAKFFTLALLLCFD